MAGDDDQVGAIIMLVDFEEDQRELSQNYLPSGNGWLNGKKAPSWALAVLFKFCKNFAKQDGTALSKLMSFNDSFLKNFRSI